MSRTIQSNWHRHKKTPIAPAQLQALQAQYSRLKRDGDPRVDIGVKGVGADERAQRLIWAKWQLGEPVPADEQGHRSFTNLSASQAEYLLDILGAGLTKLDAKINSEFNRLGVRDQAAYFNAFLRSDCQSRVLWRYRGRALNELNRLDKISLVQMLVNREPKAVQEEMAACDEGHAELSAV